MRIMFLFAKRGNGRHRDILAFVKVPELLPAKIRFMRVRIGNLKEERPLVV